MVLWWPHAFAFGIRFALKPPFSTTFIIGDRGKLGDQVQVVSGIVDDFHASFPDIVGLPTVAGPAFILLTCVSEMLRVDRNQWIEQHNGSLLDASFSRYRKDHRHWPTSSPSAPKYRLGRYGPHGNDALLDVDSSSDAVADASIQVQNMSGISGNEHS